MNRILVVNVNWLGDVIFSSPVFKALKDHYPQAKISCLAAPRVREVLESIPAVDEIIIYDEEGEHKNFWGKLKLIGVLSKKHFDAAFLLHRSLTRALLVFLAGIPRRIGYDTKNRSIFLTRRIKAPSVDSLHRVDYYLNVLESFGIPVRDRVTSLAVSPTAESEIHSILKSLGVDEKDYVVVIHPGGNWNLKRWPPANFNLLISQLTRDPRVKVIITGAESDKGLADEITASLARKPVNLAGNISLRQLIALAQRADCMVSADSGPLHIASSVGTPVVGIFGPTDPGITGPRGSGRSVILRYDVGCNRKPCYYSQCPDNICMQAVSVQKVLDAVEQIKNS
ncbi:MAG: lipopolysaccharide heptosyltransferase II [Candidatus Omnitrophica bacterium]|nr:lipopolysaccharide heptosyltransferase II [Candidatus Omnitrophota bacterium]